MNYSLYRKQPGSGHGAYQKSDGLNAGIFRKPNLATAPTGTVTAPTGTTRPGPTGQTYRDFVVSKHSPERKALVEKRKANLNAKIENAYQGIGMKKPDGLSMEVMRTKYNQMLQNNPIDNT